MSHPPGTAALPVAAQRLVGFALFALGFSGRVSRIRLVLLPAFAAALGLAKLLGTTAVGWILGSFDS
jgi:hypothetical protein